MNTHKLMITGLILSVGVLLAGCKEGGPGRTGHIASPEQAPIRIAVIPFEPAQPQFDVGAQAVTQEVVTALIETGLFEVVEPGIVYQVLANTGFRTPYGINRETMEAIQQEIGSVQVFVVGTVSDYSEVRIGSQSYPSISIAARILDGQTARILWAGSVSRSGADSEKLFGIGAVHSLGRLARAAVRSLIRKADQQQVAAMLAREPGVPTGPSEAPPSAVSAQPTGPTGSEKYLDEAATYAEADLTALMVDVQGLAKGAVEYRQHYFDIVETTYGTEEFEINVKLVEYRKVETARSFVKHEHPEETEQEFDGLPAYQGSSSHAPGIYYLDVAVGRFGLFLRGPADHTADIENVARALIAAMS